MVRSLHRLATSKATFCDISQVRRKTCTSPQIFVGCVRLLSKSLLTKTCRVSDDSEMRLILLVNIPVASGVYQEKVYPLYFNATCVFSALLTGFPSEERMRKRRNWKTSRKPWKVSVTFQWEHSKSSTNFCLTQWPRKGARKAISPKRSSLPCRQPMKISGPSWLTFR